MCIKNVKRALAATLMATLVMASTLTAAAGGTGGTGGSGGGSSISGNSTAEAANSDSGSSSNDGSSSSEVNTPETVAVQVEVVKAGGAVKLAGTSVTNTVAGAIVAKSVQGVAVTTPLANVKANLGLAVNQTPYITVFDTDAKKSNLAMACVNSAVQANGGSVVTSLNVDLGAKNSNGKFVTLSNGSAAMAVGLPKNADTSKTYYVVCVQPGGVITVLQDQDTNPATVTFEIKAGLGTYALVAK